MKKEIPQGLGKIYERICELVDEPESNLSLSDLHTEGVDNLIRFKVRFNEKAQALAESERIKIIREKYYSKPFCDFLLSDLSSEVITTNAEGLMYDQTSFIRDIKNFRKTKTPKGDWGQRSKYDAFSVLLGFDGYYEGRYFGFDLGAKQKSETESFEIVNIFKKQVETDYHQFESLRVLLEDVIKADSLNPDDIVIRIEGLTDPLRSQKQFDWVQKEMLASALAISVFNHWDLGKVQLLGMLLESKEEPLVYHRASIGIAFALLAASSNQEQFDSTIDELNDFENDDRLSFIVFSVLLFFKKHSSKPFEAEVHHISEPFLYKRADRYYQPDTTFSKRDIPDAESLFSALRFKESYSLYLSQLNDLVLNDSEASKFVSLMESDQEVTQEIHTLILRFERKVNGKRQLFHSDAYWVDCEISKAYYQLLTGFIISVFGNKSSAKQFFPPILDAEELVLNAIYQAFPSTHFAKIMPLEKVLRHDNMAEPQGLMGLGDFLRQQTNGRPIDFENAITCYKEAINKTENEYRCFNGIAFSLIRLAIHSNQKPYYQDAIIWFDAILNDYDKSKDSNRLTSYDKFIALSGKGLCTLEIAIETGQLHEIEDAIVLLKDALKLEDFNVHVMQELGRCYLEMARMSNDHMHIEHAIHWYQYSFEFNERDVYAIHRLAMCYALDGEIRDRPESWNKASKLFNEAHEMDDQDSLRLLEMGDHWERLSKNPDFDLPNTLLLQAIQWYTKALTVEGDSTELKERLFECHLSLWDIDHKIEDLTEARTLLKALTQNEKELKFWLTDMAIGLANRSGQVMDYNIAIDLLERLLVLQNDDHKILNYLGWAYHGLAKLYISNGQPEPASYKYNQAIKAFEDALLIFDGYPPSLRGIAYASFDSTTTEGYSAYEIAKTHLETLVDFDVLDFKAKFLLGKCLLHFGRLSSDQQEFQKAQSLFQEVALSISEYANKANELMRVCELEILALKYSKQ